MITQPLHSEPNYTLLAQQDTEDTQHPDEIEPNDEDFGGHEARKQLERKLLRKLDTRMSILVLIYILNYMDRNNVAVARLRGFEEDLRLVNGQFDNLLSILYVGYIIMQVPSNMYLNHLGKPSVYLPCCMVGWGVLSIMTGFANNYTGALLIRFSLGFVEAAFFPGALFLLSKWYKRGELGLRTAVLFCGGLISNAFGTLLASAILDSMEGKLGRAAWRWLFYIEGGLTVLVALAAIFILPDFPATSRFLSPLERKLAIRRIEEDVGSGGDSDETESSSGPLAGLLMAAKDLKVWWLALVLSLLVLSLSFNAFFPTLCATLGYETNVTLLLCAPPWFVAAGFAFAVSRHSDKVGERFWHIVIPLLVGQVGFILAWLTLNPAVRYFALFLMAQSYAGFICLLAWASNSIPRPPAKRAVALAFINAVSQLGNVFGSQIWPKKYHPRYSNSFLMCILANLETIIMCWMFRMMLMKCNLLEEQVEVREGRSKGWRYML